MSDTRNGSGTTAEDHQVAPDETARVNEVMRRLDAWKSRIDELRVQVDLAKLDLRDEAEKQLDLARNVNQVAASKLTASRTRTQSPTPIPYARACMSSFTT